MKGTALWAAALGCAAMACGSSSDGGGGSDDDGGSGGGSGSGGAKCWDVPVNDTNAGESACGPEVCAAGSYCVSTVGICDPGCLSELNCPPQQTCDLSNATMGPEGQSVGLCQTPGAEHEIACSNGAGGNGGGDCSTRCLAKAAQCEAPESMAGAYCTELCSTATEEQLSCIETTSCAELGEAFEMGSPLCGLSG